VKTPQFINILVACGGENAAAPPRHVGTADLIVRQEHLLKAGVSGLCTLTHGANLAKLAKPSIAKGLLKKIAYGEIIRELIKAPMISFIA
jgi:hypothetical protein